MIQIYKSSNVRFSTNGDIVIEPISCTSTVEINGVWKLELNCIASEKNISAITENSVVKVPSPEFTEDQLWRIYSVEKDEDEILALAYPIFLDSAQEHFLFDVRPTLKNGQEALNMIFSGSKYSGTSNISTRSTAYYIRKNPIEAISSDFDQSFLNRWGGEIIYDNYRIIINDEIGTDNGVSAEFGYNIRAIKESVDMTNVVTRIIPEAFNGYVLPGKSPWVESPIAGSYPFVRYKVVKFDNVKLKTDAQEDDIESGIIVCDTLDQIYAKLRELSLRQYEKGLDKPTITYDIDILDLSQTAQYKDFSNLVKIRLGDTVHVRYAKLGTNIDVRCIALTYDHVTEEITNIVLGNPKRNYFDGVSSTIDKISGVVNSDGTLIAEKVKGILSAIDISIRAQSSIAKKAGERAILFEDTDPDSPTYGASCYGTQGLQIAKTKDEDGNWEWRTAITAAGIVASCLITGLISDRAGRSFWDLDGGGMSMVGSFLSDNLVGDVAKIEDGKIVLLRNGKKTAEIINSINAGRIIPTINLYDDSGEIVFQVSRDYLKTRAVTAETLSLKIPDSGNPGMSRRIMVDESAGSKKWLYVE